MIAKTNSASVLGIDAHPVDVEVDVSIGLSTFNIVGLPDGTIKESRDRVTAAVTNSGFNFPVRRIVVNLAPAALRKIGSGFDLPIALALLGAPRYFPEQVLEKVMVSVNFHSMGRSDRIGASSRSRLRQGIMVLNS